MSNYEDDQSEDGELARSPVQDEMDFSLSDEDRDNPDALVIKPPQAVIRSHRDKRNHKHSAKERYKEGARKEKKLYRDRDKSDKIKREVSSNMDREDIPKDYYRDKQYYREKDLYRDKDIRDKDMYREREMREKDGYREKEVYREKDPYREREHYRERDVYRETAYRDVGRQREVYRSKELYKDKDVQREREMYIHRDRQYKYTEAERKHLETDKIETRLRMVADESRGSHNHEKENRDKTSGDKELEDLRSRLLSKRMTKELQTQDSKKYPEYEKDFKSASRQSYDKLHLERKNRLLEAEREMVKRKHESRSELEARREDRRRRGKKRSVTPEEGGSKKNKTSHSPNYGDSVVEVSDASDVEMKTDTHSEPEEGEHSNSDTEDDSSSTDSESAKSEQDVEEKSVNEKPNPTAQSKSPSPKSIHASPSSHESRRSLSRSKSRSRSHSFSPPPPDENGKTPIEEVKPTEDDESARLKEEAINSLPPYFPALQGCRSVEEFQCLNRIEEGTYGVVYRARDKTTEEIVALKRLKMEKEKEGFPITSLREINTLLKGQHPNIVTVREIVVGSNMDKIFIVMDYVEHDLKSLMETMRNKKQVFLPGEVKCLMTQLLRAVHHLHDNWILHRDLKTSNLLLSHKGILKVGDFGLAREYGSPLRQYTPIVVTLWYRAPELLLCCKEYSTPIDMWSVGCIFAEFITMNPLFPGKSEVDQLNRIFKDMGTPSELLWPGYKELPAVQKMTFAEHPPGGLKQRVGADLLSESGLALLQGFLTYNPLRRVTADAALEHAYFKENPVAIDPAMFPTWPAKSEGNRRTTHSPKPPAGGAAYAHYARADSDEALGFQLQARSLNVAPGFSLKF
ncbi:cyclin-dependent kinase 11B isoform X1 [Pieris napi]|uniref:cyclin-dependent kinase 11B isoform X1 n=2 Tax=Pieris napi TaxID=78633 RepID=UPI001FB8CE66|nr:cyclin-dependent kinase 11B isoform X1 [Pieris napi]XP_047509827.1 cyclin-dependent kinase 11B isoform X1 [Pieris napi]